KLRMTPEEAVNAATINGAYAMDLLSTHGSITRGKKANVMITKKLNSFYEIPYNFGDMLIEQVIINGKRVEKNTPKAIECFWCEKNSYEKYFNRCYID